MSVKIAHTHRIKFTRNFYGCLSYTQHQFNMGMKNDKYLHVKCLFAVIFTKDKCINDAALSDICERSMRKI